MHGQAKVKTSEEEMDKERKKKMEKAKAYREGMTKIFLKRKRNENDTEALGFITDVLAGNPDVYTLWNIRKEILLEIRHDKTDDEIKKLISDEMWLTECCLRINPKSYGAWYHRLWLINNFEQCDLERELALCKKFLKYDSRNFHCWDYRRHVAKKLELSASEELSYTTEKIEENFSNYSSWHYRSKLLPLIHPDPAGIRPIVEEVHLHELDLVQNAAFTDPTDQSAWFYLRWLLGRLEPRIELNRLFLSNCKTRVFAVFNRNLNPASDGVTLSGPHPTWTAWSSEKSSSIWVSKIIRPEDSVSFELRLPDQDSQAIELSQENDYIWYAKPKFDPEVSPKLLAVLKDQLNSCDQLIELEPDSKWTLLTAVVLMRAIDKAKYKDEISIKLDLLKKHDSYRSNYYNDLSSRYAIEDHLENLDFTTELDWANSNLTSLYHGQYLSHLLKVDLTGNSLQFALPSLEYLVNCQTLILDKNKLSNLRKFPALPKLSHLSLKYNLLAKNENVFPHLKCLGNIITLSLTGNKLLDALDVNDLEERLATAISNQEAN